MVTEQCTYEIGLGDIEETLVSGNHPKMWIFQAIIGVPWKHDWWMLVKYESHDLMIES